MSCDKSVRTTNHNKTAALPNVRGEAAQVNAQAVRLRVEVLQDDGIETLKVLGEELIDWKWNQREVVL